MLIALIDDGIDTSVYPDIRVKYDLSVERDGVIRERAGDRIITNHGSTCARIIANYAPNAEFCSLRVFQRDNLRASCVQLAAAMEWCLEARVPIVHMSLGTSLLSDYETIRSIAVRMIQQRQIIVAACSNSGGYSMPAYLSGVVGVLADPELEGAEYVLPSGSNFIHASSRHTTPLPWGQALTTYTANSYAAPTVTAAVHNILEGREAFSMSVRQVYRELVGYPEGMTFVRPDFIEDAVILNPGGAPVLKQHLFFNCLAEYQGAPKMVELSSDCKSMVYLVPQGSGEVPGYDIGQVAAGKIETFLYGGSLTKDDKNTLSELLVWSEDCCRNPYDPPGDPGLDQPAVINLHGQGLAAIDLMCRLRGLFIADGFHCRGICDFPYSYLYDLEYVPPGVAVPSAITHVCLTYRPEVLICNFQGLEQGAVGEEGSYSIHLGDEVGNDAEGLSWVQSSYVDLDIVALYSRIMEFFS